MTGQAPAEGPKKQHERRNLAIAASAVVGAWLLLTITELANAGVDNGLISRPERLNTTSSGWACWVVAISWGVSLLSISQWLRLTGLLPRRLKPRDTAVLLAVVAWVMLMWPQYRDAPYELEFLTGYFALAFLILAPPMVAICGARLRETSLALAWLSGAVAVLMPIVAAWQLVQSARAGGLEPQLWATVFVRAMLVGWVALVSLWLLGMPDWLRSKAPKLPEVRPPAPGRKAAFGLAVVSIAGVVFAGGGYARLVWPAVANQLTGRTTVGTIQVESDLNIARSYRLYRPANLQAQPGLVVILHGSSGGGFQAETSTNFDAQADRLGWLAVYPDGVLDGWDTIPGQSVRSHPGADDVAFIRALIAQLAADYNVDPARIYVTGFSRGASMSYRLGCELSDVVAAIAPVSGNMATAEGSVADFTCQTAKPVSILAIHGTADGTIPIDGGGTAKFVKYAPMTDVIARWRTLDGCASAAASTSTDGASSLTTWSCATHTEITTRVVAGGAHAWPGAVAGLPYSTSNPADAFDASRLIADFFEAHPRAG